MKWALMFAAFCLSGCATIGTAVEKGADANDSAVQAAEFTLCQGASVGSIRRAFGTRPEIWRELCADDFVIGD